MGVLGPSAVHTQLHPDSSAESARSFVKNMVEFSTGGGRASTVDIVVATQIQKKPVLVLFQVFDLSRVVITVLHEASIRVR